MYFELKSVNVWSMIKVWFFLNLIVGLGIGLVYAFFSFLTVAAAGELLFLRAGLDVQDLSPGLILIMLPIAFALGHAIFGTLLVALLSVVYNITARLFGGLQFEAVQDDDDSDVAAADQVTEEALTPKPERHSEYSAPPPPPPPLGSVRPDPPPVPTGPFAPKPTSPERHPPVSTGPDPAPSDPVEPKTTETPTVDWPVPPPPPPRSDPNDKPENRPD